MNTINKNNEKYENPLGVLDLNGHGLVGRKVTFTLTQLEAIRMFIEGAKNLEKNKDVFSKEELAHQCLGHLGDVSAFLMHFVYGITPPAMAYDELFLKHRINPDCKDTSNSQ